MSDSKQPPGEATRKFLPWGVVVAALVLYGVTLHHWVSLSGLPLVARVTGWDWWNTVAERPLFHLLTLPLRALPTATQITGLNIFSALCAALTLGLLARSITLLPHDRTRDQRQRERGPHGLLSMGTNWLPPLLGVLVCGLQLTFWEHATAATGEVLDLLLFAAVILCLLEFRIARQDRWLHGMAFIYGLATANNWAMIGFFPLFLVALVWIKGRGFFSLKFFAAATGFGCLGLSLYLLLPLLPSLNHAPGESFAELLRIELGAQKNILLAFPRSRTLILALTSVLPVVLIGIRWPSSVGETSPVAGIIGSLVFRTANLALLAVIVWVAFDPEYSPRRLGFGLPFLTFYYLAALAAGYFAGYLLLIFGSGSGNAWDRPSLMTRLFGYVVVGALWVTLIAAPAGLVYRNGPQIRISNGNMVKEFARTLGQAVPATKSIIIGTHPQELMLLSAILQEDQRPLILLDLSALASPRYQMAFLRRHPEGLPGITFSPEKKLALTPVQTGQIVDFLCRSNDVFALSAVYAHPFLEADYLEPRGLVYAVKSYGTNLIAPPAMSAEVLAANQKFWEESARMLPSLGATHQEGSDGAAIAEYYSAALNHWAVMRQAAGGWPEAGRLFELALAFNPHNPAAQVNLAFNQYWHDRPAKPTAELPEMEAKLNDYRNWNVLYQFHGPLDEPRACLQRGIYLAKIQLWRQAAQQFVRAQTLSPTNLMPHLALGEVFMNAGMPAEAEAALRKARALQATLPPDPTGDVSLLRLEALSSLKSDSRRAEQILLAAARKYPQSVPVLESLIEVYLHTNQATNALEVTERALKLAPENLSLSLTHGAILLQTRQFDRAATALDRVLSLQPNHLGAIIYRANANLGANNLPAAERDFLAAFDLAPNMPMLPLGLAEVAERQKRPAEAIKQYEAALKLIPTTAPQREQISKRINELKSK